MKFSESDPELTRRAKRFAVKRLKADFGVGPRGSSIFEPKKKSPLKRTMIRKSTKIKNNRLLRAQQKTSRPTRSLALCRTPNVRGKVLKKSKLPRQKR